jgi:3-methyladenine DNA glycosylase AlkC
MSEKNLLKDQLFNPASVARLTGDIARAYPAFDAKAFTRVVLGKFPALELKARITWIAECLRAHLPSDYRKALRVLIKALPAPNDPSLSDNDFGDFIHAPLSDFVARYGVTARDLEISLDALREITMRFSAEDAIRFFINAYPEQTFATLTRWSTDANYHVRRLCSEGTRPTLPWSQKLNTPVTTPVVLLNTLFADHTRYVTRSVANHVNDIAKIDPALAIQLLTDWQASGRQRPEEMRYIVAHALRTLIKQGDARALALIGAGSGAAVRVTGVNIPAKVAMNSTLEFSFVLEASEDVDAVVDYIITFQSKSGKPASKVFKLKRVTLGKGEKVALAKRHLLREHMTTRKLFRGRHALELQINGRRFGAKPFDIV